MSSNREATVTILSIPESTNVPTEFEKIVTTDDKKYRFSGRVLNHDTFSLKIINEDYTLRWAADFSANYIDDLTTKAGCVKKISVFWKMLTEIAENESQTASVEVLTALQVQEIAKSKSKNKIISSQNSDNIMFNLDPGDERNTKLFVVLTQKSEYDLFKYPLSLPPVPFTYEEYAQTIKLLYHDNAQLHKSLIAADCSQLVVSLENKVSEFAAMFAEMKKAKDEKIKALKKKIKFLQARQKEQNQINMLAKSKK